MTTRSVRRSLHSIPASVESVRRRIDHWRKTRERRTHMPEDLWAAAAAAAREHGLWFVSRTLRVSYEYLKRRVVAMPEDGGVAGGFVEVSPALWQNQGAATATTVVELSKADGTRLMLRVQGHGALDVPALAAAFWQSDR